MHDDDRGRDLASPLLSFDVEDSDGHIQSPRIKGPFSPNANDLFAISAFEKKDDDDSIPLKINLAAQSLATLSQLLGKKGYPLPKTSQLLFSTERLPEQPHESQEEDISLALRNVSQIFSKDPRLNTLIQQLVLKRTKIKPHQRHPYWYSILAFLSFVNIAGILAFTKFNWDLLEDTINGTDDTPALVTDATWQEFFFIVRILLVALDLGARTCVIDFLESPQIFIAQYCQCDPDDQSEEFLSERPSRSMFSKIMEFLIVDFMPFTLPFFQYAIACTFDIKGINAIMDRTWYRDLLNISSVLSTPIYFFLMYTTSKEEFRKRVRTWFNESHANTNAQHPPSPWLRLVRLYDFSKTSFVYTLIQTVVFLFAADHAARMLSEWWWGEYSQGLDYSFQTLAGVSTLCSTIDSQILKRFDGVYIPRRDYDNFYTFFQNCHLTSYSLSRWAKIIALGFASSFLPAWGIFQLLLTTKIFNYILSIIAGAPFFALEYFTVNNYEKINAFNRHKEIQELYQELEKDTFLVANTEPPQNFVSAGMVNENYRNKKSLVHFFSDLPDKAYTSFPTTTKDTVSDLCGFLSEHCSRYEKLLLLYRKHIKSTSTKPARGMHRNIAKLYEDHQRSVSADNLPDAHWFNIFITTFFNVGSQLLHQISLIMFFRTVSEKYFYISNSTTLAAALSIGTQFSIQNAANYQGWISMGVSAWSNRIKYAAGTIHTKLCSSNEHAEDIVDEQIPARDKTSSLTAT